VVVWGGHFEDEPVEEVAAGLRAQGLSVESWRWPLRKASWSAWLDEQLERFDRVVLVQQDWTDRVSVRITAPWHERAQDRSDGRRFRVVPVQPDLRRVESMASSVASPHAHRGDDDPGALHAARSELFDLPVVKWEGPASTPALLRRLRDGRLPGDRRTVELPGGVKLELAFIPAGTFAMGSPEGVGHGDERPQHVVTLSRPYWMGVTPVTQAQWAAVAAGGEVKADSSHFKGAHRPVEMVSWDDARAWCNALSARLGLDPRLP
jgi:hypothetical protein